MIWVYIIISYLSLFCLGLSDNVRGPLYVDILDHFQLSNFVGAWIFAGSSLLAMFASLIVKYIFRALHPYKVLQVSMVLMGSGLMIMGWAPTFLFFMLGTVFFGVSIGWLGVSQNFLVTVGSSHHQRSRALSGLHAMYASASLGAPFVVTLLSKTGMAWGTILILVGSFSFAVFLISLFIPHKKYFASTQPHSKQDKLSTSFDFKMLKFAFILGLYVVSEILLSSRLAALFRLEYGSNLQDSSFYLMCFFFVFLLGRLLFLFLNVRWSLKKVLICSHILNLLFFVLGIFVSPYFLLLCGLSMAPFYPMAISFLAESFPYKIGQAITWSMSIQSLLIVVMHLLVGKITDLYGLKSAIGVGLFCCFVSFILLLSFDSSEGKPH